MRQDSRIGLRRGSAAMMQKPLAISKCYGWKDLQLYKPVWCVIASVQEHLSVGLLLGLSVVSPFVRQSVCPSVHVTAHYASSDSMQMMHQVARLNMLLNFLP